MDIRKLQRAIVDGLEDVKGHNIVVFNTEHLSPLFERVIIASGTSNRQTKALASGVRDAVKSRGFPVMRTEGEDNGEWIIVDCGAAVVHLMQPGIREYYHLEEIWGEKPVRMKLDTAPVRLVKAGDGDLAAAEARKVRPASKPPRSPAAGKVKAEAGAPVATKRAAPKPRRAPANAGDAAGAARRAATPSATAKKTAPTRGAITRTVGVKAPAKKAPARKSPTRTA